MSISYFTGSVIFLVSWVVYSWVKNELSWMLLRRRGKKGGCEAPKEVENKLPGGIERFYAFFKGIESLDILDDLVRPPYRNIGNTFRTYNPFYQTILSTAEPENVQAVLATKFDDYCLGEMRTGNMHELFGPGIFTAGGEEWARYRQQLKPQFSRDQISDLEAADRHLQILYRALPQQSSEEVDILPLLLRYTMDVSTEFLFGQSVNSQTTALQSYDSGNKQGNLLEEEKFVQAITDSQEHVIWRIRLQSLWWLSRPQKFLAACQTCKDFTSRFVQTALQAPKQSSSLVNEKEREREKYVLLNALTAETRNATELRDQMLHLLLAGRDTTAALLAWTLGLLARHPETYTRYRSIILSHFGSATNPTQEITFSSLKACKEINHLLHETLRLYPAVPVNQRTAIRDTVLPVGGGEDGKSPVVVRKGEIVSYNAYEMHRRTDLWGEDAEEWRPERWVGRKLGWEFVGFSGGPRVCIGQQYALTEASFVIARFLQKYERIEADPTAKLQKNLTLVLTPKEVKIRLFPAAT